MHIHAIVSYLYIYKEIPPVKYSTKHPHTIPNMSTLPTKPWFLSGVRYEGHRITVFFKATQWLDLPAGTWVPMKHVGRGLTTPNQVPQMQWRFRCGMVRCHDSEWIHVHIYIFFTDYMIYIYIYICTLFFFAESSLMPVAAAQQIEFFVHLLYMFWFPICLMS